MLSTTCVSLKGSAEPSFTLSVLDSAHPEHDSLQKQFVSNWQHEKTAHRVSVVGIVKIEVRFCVVRRAVATGREVYLVYVFSEKVHFHGVSNHETSLPCTIHRWTDPPPLPPPIKDNCGKRPWGRLPKVGIASTSPQSSYEVHSFSCFLPRLKRFSVRFCNALPRLMLRLSSFRCFDRF